MGQKARARGFHTPFSALKKHVAQPVERPTAKAAADARARARQAEAQDADDNSVFARAMADIQPHQSRVAKVLVPKAPPKEILRISDDDMALAELEGMVRGEGAFRVHESEEVHFGLAPGVSRTLLDNLVAGHYAYHHHCLDLHGMVREQAHQAVDAFIRRSRCELGVSCVLVVTGRGRGSPDGHSVLREALPRWLTRSPIKPHVLAFCTARAIDGGPGAFYVLLRRQGVRPFGVADPR